MCYRIQKADRTLSHSNIKLLVRYNRDKNKSADIDRYIFVERQKKEE